MRFARLLLLAVLALPALACSDLGELMSLQQELTHEFNTGAVNVNTNNAVHLTVIFSNSPAAELPDSDRAAFARRVAEYVRDHYPGYERLQTIRIGFAKVSGAGAVKFTSSRAPYRFTPRDLGPPRSAALESAN